MAKKSSKSKKNSQNFLRRYKLEIVAGVITLIIALITILPGILAEGPIFEIPENVR